MEGYTHTLAEVNEVEGDFALVEVSAVPGAILPELTDAVRFWLRYEGLNVERLLRGDDEVVVIRLLRRAAPNDRSEDA